MRRLFSKDGAKLLLFDEVSKFKCGNFKINKLLKIRQLP